MLRRELSSSGGGASLLEALAAEHRTALRGLERDCGFLAASRAVRTGFYLVVGRRSARSYAERALPLGFAGFAALRFVFELLVVEEQLFASREEKL